MGTLLRDYHTAQVPSAKKGVAHYSRRSELLDEKLNTILSTRDYRCDAAYTVAIRVSDRSTVSARMISEKLRKPDFTLYLGRKSCPLALPLQPKVVQVTNFKEALETVSFANDALPGVLTSSQVSVYWENGAEGGYESDHVVTRRDEPLSRKRWQFSERRESYASIRKEG